MKGRDGPGKPFRYRHLRLPLVGGLWETRRIQFMHNCICKTSIQIARVL